ncbi:MAG: glycosyltransferase family 4 protein [Gammaproteobacteria bacterium]|nr:glycosyltransferase family 4 protein [Gammaproteobacteria bacterium]
MTTPKASSRPGILLVANYSNRTGYAWNNIYRLFEHVACELRGMGLASWVSFAKYEPPLEWDGARSFDGVLELPPDPQGSRELFHWFRMIRRHSIRYLYLTDQANWAWRYAIFRAAGVQKIIVHSRVSVANPRPAAPETGIRGALKWLVSRLPFIQADRVYAVSEFVRNRLIVKARIPSRRVVTILDGVDLERFSPRENHNQRAMVEIFCGGRATVHKGIQVLIEATAMLQTKHGLSSFRVSYAGDGPDMQKFVELAESLRLGSSFRFLGQQPSTEELVSVADIIVVPSTWGDAGPLAISEALAAGKPLVATRVGGVPELIGEESAAIMVEPGDSAGLAEALAGLISSRPNRERFAARARSRAEQTLDQRRYYSEVILHLACDLGLESRSSGEVADSPGVRSEHSSPNQKGV